MIQGICCWFKPCTDKRKQASAYLPCYRRFCIFVGNFSSLIAVDELLVTEGSISSLKRASIKYWSWIVLGPLVVKKFHVSSDIYLFCLGFATFEFKRPLSIWIRKSDSVASFYRVLFSCIYWSAIWFYTRKMFQFKVSNYT